MKEKNSELKKEIDDDESLTDEEKEFNKNLADELTQVLNLKCEHQWTQIKRDDGKIWCVLCGFEPNIEKLKAMFIGKDKIVFEGHKYPSRKSELEEMIYNHDNLLDGVYIGDGGTRKRRDSEPKNEPSTIHIGETQLKIDPSETEENMEKFLLCLDNLQGECERLKKELESKLDKVSQPFTKRLIEGKNKEIERLRNTREQFDAEAYKIQTGVVKEQTKEIGELKKDIGTLKNNIIGMQDFKKNIKKILEEILE